MPAGFLKEVRGWVRLPLSGQQALVRMVCCHLPAGQAKLTRERKAAKLRKKHGARYNHELVPSAGWVILATTAERSVWSGQDLVRLYRARWQIELFFKQLKGWQRVSCVVQLCLISWWLQEQEADWLRELLMGLLWPVGEQISELSEPEEGCGEQEVGEWMLSSWTLAHDAAGGLVAPA